MTYKNRVIFLLSLCAVLLCAYMTSVIFTSDSGRERRHSYSWLDSKSAQKVTKIEIDTGREKFALLKESGAWFVSHNGNKYPARKTRAEDLVNILSGRSAWTVRSSSSSHHGRFGLDENSPRVTVYGEYSVLLDLLAGFDDAAGAETYFCKYGQNEVRSGEKTLKTYMTGDISSWYNLRLFPKTAESEVKPESVQRITVRSGEQSEQRFTRSGRIWEIEGFTLANPDYSQVESYIKNIFNSEGENFADLTLPDGFKHSSITVEFSDGKTENLFFSERDENDRCYVQVQGTGYVYSVSPWTLNRLFKDASSFETR